MDNSSEKQAAIRCVVREGQDTKEVLALWKRHRKEDGEVFLRGHIIQDGEKIEITGNIVPAGISKRTGNPYSAFISLRGDDFEATGRALNTSKTGECYFDTVVFNIKGKENEKPIFARTTKECDKELRDLIGFKSESVARPPRQGNQNPRHPNPGY